MSQPQHDEAVDYVALEQRVADIVSELDHWVIDPNRVRFETSGRVESGSFGDLFRGKYDGYQSHIAIKMLRPVGDRNQCIRVAAALARELRAWERANHPNIVRLFGFFINQYDFSSAWLVSWWAYEGDILHYINRKQPDERKRMALVQDTADGLAYLHGLDPPICHADIKPANTLVNSHGQAMICDFGMAKIIDSIPSGLTTIGGGLGTVRYLSPEVVMLDNHPHTLQSDIWAWGCLVLEVMTGRIPFQGVRDQAVMFALAQSKLPANVNELSIPAFLKSLLSKAWAILSTGSRPSMRWCTGFLKGSLVLHDYFTGSENYETLQMYLVDSEESPYVVDLSADWTLVTNPLIPQASTASVSLSESGRIEREGYCESSWLSEDGKVIMMEETEESRRTHEWIYTIYERNQGNIICALKTGEFPIRTAAVSSDGSAVAACCIRHNNVSFWHVTNPESSLLFTPDGKPLSSPAPDNGDSSSFTVRFAPNTSDTLIVVHAGIVRIWDLHGTRSRTFSVPDCPMVWPAMSGQLATFSRKAKMSGGDGDEGDAIDFEVEIWHMGIGSCLHRARPHGRFSEHASAFVSGGYLLVYDLSEDDYVFRYSAYSETTESPLRPAEYSLQLLPVPDTSDGLTSSLLISDGQVGVLDHGSCLTLWNLKTKTLLSLISYNADRCCIWSCWLLPNPTVAGGTLVVSTSRGVSTFEYSLDSAPKDT